MLVAAIACILSEPILDAVEFDRGVASARRGYDLSKTLEDMRHGLGRWHDGKQFRTTEVAVALTPKVVSRWIGWLQTTCGWGEHHVQQAWSDYLSNRKNGLIILVRLTAFPKESFLDLTEQTPPDPTDLDSLSFEAEQSRVTVPIDLGINVSIRRPQPEEVLGDRWLQLALPTILRPPYDSKFRYPLGDYHARYLQLVAETTSAAGTIDVRISNKRRPRTARFRLE